MLAAVIQITEIEFEESDKGVAQIKDVAPFVHGEFSTKCKTINRTPISRNLDGKLVHVYVCRLRLV